MLKPKEWTAAEKQRLKAMAKRGDGVSRIAAELGRYAASVKRTARSLGIAVKK
jgi:transposase-like protein